MNALPPALRPWAELLAPFDAEVSRVLGGYLLRLAAAFGDLGHGRRGDAEPDGFEGISSRGPYERLLASEWLLHDELPDEFLRRAAMNEQLFLERSFQKPQRSRHVFVLLDTGCEQLGAPRLLQLAWLILQKQRADAAHAAFSWGVIQQPEVVHQELAPSRIEAALRDSQFRLPARHELEHWALTARALSGTDECEIWRVGGRHLLRLECEPESFVLCVEPEITRESQSRLTVSCYLPGHYRSPQRVLHLELPAPELAVRILREPIGKPTLRPPTQGAPIATSDGVVLHTDQRRAWALTQEGTLMTLHIPQSVREPAAPVRFTKLARQGTPVAVGYSPSRKRSVALCVDSYGRAVLVVIGKQGGVMETLHLGGDGISPEARYGARLGQMFLARSDLGMTRTERAESEEFLCVFGDRLFHVAWGACNQLEVEDILGFAPAHYGVLLALWKDKAVRVVKAKLSEAWAVDYAQLGAVLEDVGGPVLLSAEPMHPRRAYRSTAGKWIVRDAGLQLELPVPEGARPCAVLHGSHGPELLAIGADPSRLYRINVDGSSLLLRFKHRIVDLAASQQRLLILTEAGQLFAYQLSPLAQLLHYEPGA
ncbi:MAG: hypothetical protein R3B07_35210 [Polyangiaceae bacterium]